MKVSRRWLLAAVPATAALIPAQRAVAASLRKEDAAAFERYTRDVEAAVGRRSQNGAITGFPVEEPQKADVTVFSLAKENPRDIGGAYIHDWSGRAHLRGGTASALLQVLKDYNRHKEYYGPEVVDSRHLGNDGTVLKSFLRLRKKKVLTVILDTEYRNRFYELTPSAGYSVSHTVSIHEVENAGEPGERRLPDGEGHGFLWRLNAYWMWQQNATGLWVECRAVSLSRDVPAGLGWVVAPIIRSLPRESLESTLSNTAKAIAALQRG